MRSLMVRSLVAMGAMAVVACGPKKKGDDDIIDPSQIPSSYGNSQSTNYRLADVDCNKGTGVEQVVSGTFYSFFGGEVTSQKADFNGFSGNPWLRSLGVNQTKVGMVGQQKCRNGMCNSNLTVSNPGYVLKVCNATADFPRDSIEGISINTLVHLNNIQAFYQSVGKDNPALANLEMMIMPSFFSGSDGSEIKMDNLSYYPMLDSKPYVVVFPKSKAGERLWPGYNLWESPWVIAHEVSHHVFRTNFLSISSVPVSIREALDVSHPIIDLPKERENKDAGSYYLADLASREITKDDLLGAVNEGFADLFGYYSVGERRDITTGFNCFRNTRDVASASFADGTAKAFTNNALDTFFSPTQVAPSSRQGVLSCEMPNFQGIHTIGAIFAYAFDQLLSQNTEVMGASNKTIVKANLALKWVRAISHLGLSTPNKEAIGRLLRTAVDVAAGAGITAEQCRLVNDLFPAYVGDWRQESAYGAALKCP